MKDQNTVREHESKEDKIARARSLFIESVLKPDNDLRGCAHNQKCYHELMEIRNDVLHFLGHETN
tara:strand:+ start:7103 stop:7297 length:195 start_codon:yes stop_codon:yes gene_type:complete